MAIKDKSDYDTIRRLIHQIYLYGCFTVSDISSNKLIGDGISDRSIKDYIHKLTNYINSGQLNPDKFIEKHTIPGRKTDKKSPRMVHDIFKCSYNYLAASYSYHAITAPDLIFFIYFLYALPQDSLESSIYDDVVDVLEQINLNADELNTELSDSFSAALFYETLSSIYITNNKLIAHLLSKDDIIDTALPFNLETCRTKLDELADMGYLRKIKSQDNGLDSMYTYSLFPSIFEFISYDDEFLLSEYIRFCIDISPISIPGYYLLQKLMMHSKVISDSKDCSDYFNQTKPTVYIQSTTRYQNIIDDDVAWQLLCHIQAMNTIIFDYESENAANTTSVIMLPIKLVSDLRYGRRYIWGWQYNKKHHYSSGEFKLLRLDRIYKPDIYDAIPSESKYSFTDESNITHTLLDELYRKYIELSFNISTSDTPSKVKLTFHFSEDNWGIYLKKLLYDTCDNAAHIKQISDYDYIYEATISDPIEMIPWIHSFGNSVICDSETSPKLFALLEQDKQRMRELYEAV